MCLVGIVDSPLCVIVTMYHLPTPDPDPLQSDTPSCHHI